MITRRHAMMIRQRIEQAAVSLTDGDAATAIELFPKWAVGVSYVIDYRVRYEDRLYKVLQPHTSSQEWTPDVAKSLYTEVEKPGEGDTPDNPIQYNNNMELVENKYYSQYDVVYRCTRSTGIPVYNDLADLVGLYVERV